MIFPKLTRDLLLIRVEKDMDIPSGVTLPDDIREQRELEKLASATVGIVEVAGPDATIPVGSEVQYKSFVGNKIEPKGDDGKCWHVIVAEGDILCFYPKTEVKN